MNAKKVFLCLMLLLVGVPSAWADKYYKVSYTPQIRYRVSTLVPGKKYMIFNTAHSVKDGQDCTGFVYNNGVGLSLDKSRDNAVLVYNDCFVFTLEAVDESNKKYALKSLSSGTYVNIEGSTSNITPQPLYIYPWDNAVEGDAFNQDSGVITENNGIKQAFINSENENYTVVFYNSITSANNKTFVIGNEDKNRYWNGNTESFAAAGDGHPYAFYEVEEVVPETFPELNLRDLHIYSRCDIYSAQQIYGYIKSAQQITADEGAAHLLDGSYLSYALSGSYEIDLALGANESINSFSLYMHRRASGDNSFSRFELQVLPVGKSEFVSVGTFETTFATEDEYLHIFTSEELGGREFTKVKIVSADGNPMGLSGLYVLPNTNVINNAFTYFDNSLPVSGTYQAYNAILEGYNHDASEVKQLSGVPIPGYKYRIYADAYSNGDYVNRHISTDGVNGNALVATGNYHSADDKSAFEWICYQTSDGSLLFRNCKYSTLFLGKGIVTTDLNAAKWEMNTNKTQRHGVPLIADGQYLAVKNDGNGWVGDVSDAQDQTTSLCCTDFVFIPVPLAANEKRITILASPLAQRNMSLTVGGVVYDTPFSLLFTDSNHLPVLTELAAQTHRFDGYYLKKGDEELVRKADVFDKVLYDNLQSGDTLVAKFEIVAPFEKSNGVKKLYRIKNMRKAEIPQQVASNRAASLDLDIEFGGDEDDGPISPSAGVDYFASFDTKNTNMSLQKEDGQIDAFELFYFTGGEVTENYYSALINSVVTTKKCKAANEWTDAGQMYYIQPNTTSSGKYTGYAITKTILDKDNNPGDAWCSEHFGGENSVVESNVNSDGAAWVFEEVSDYDAVVALQTYIYEQHEVLHAELEKNIAEQNPLYCQDKIAAYYDYIHQLAENAKKADDVAQLVAWSQEIHMLHHEIEYNLLALPTPTDETNPYNPVWYYVKNVYSGDYATYNGGENNMILCERNGIEEQTLYNLFNFAGVMQKPQTIDEYLEVHIHNLMAKNDSTLVGKNIELFSTSFEGRGVTNDPVPGVTTISKDDVWEITAEFKSNGTGANYWGTALLATGDNSVADNYSTGFQIYLQSDGDLCFKAGENGTEYIFEHTRGAYSKIKVVLTYAEHRLKIKVTNSLDVTMSLSDIGTDRRNDYINCPNMGDITKLVTNMPKTGVGITSLKAESVSAMTWNAHNAEKDTWYILPSTNEYYRGLAVVMNSPNVAEMGWALQPSEKGDVVFTDLGSSNPSTWLFERVVNFDAHIDQLLEVYNVDNYDNFVIYNKEYVALCKKLAEMAALIKAGDDHSNDEKHFNEAVAAVREYLGPDLSAFTAPREGALYTIRSVVERDTENALLVHTDWTNNTHTSKEVYLDDVILADGSFDSRAAWVFEGVAGENGLFAIDGLKVKNLHTQCYLTALGENASLVNEEGAAAITLGALGDCTTKFKVGEQLYMNRTSSTGPVVYGKHSGFWGNAVTEYPADIATVFESVTGHNAVHCKSLYVNVDAEGAVTVTFTHKTGSDKLNMLGVTLVNGDGDIVAGEYHHGTAGGSHVDNEYSLGIVAPGVYTLNLYVANLVHSDAENNDKVYNSGGEVSITGISQIAGAAKVTNTGTENTKWIIEEIKNPEESVYYNVPSLSSSSAALPDNRAYASLYLGFDAIIPDDITAWIVEGVFENNVLDMVKVDGDILPANTGVILTSEKPMSNQKFHYSTIASTFDAENNKLSGTAYTKIEDCGAKDIYMLSKKNNRIALYWTYENRDENGNKLTIGGTTNHNDGGYVMCNANKSYLEIKGAQSAIASYGFFYGGNTTEIDEVSDDVKAESGNVKAVYDLSGRKLNAITAPGIYIVDGKKVFVAEIED